MNKLLDLINRWAEKFTYRVLKMSGTSDTALENYLSAVKDRNEDVINADNELKNKTPWIRMIFIFLLVGLGAFLYDRFIERR